jgi:tetratricopeptide (TPR) repeat protein
MTLNKIILFSFISFTILFAQSSLNNKYRLAQTFESSGQLKRAKQLYEELYKNKPYNNDYLNSLNNIYLKLKEYDKSVALLKKMISKRPYDVNLYGMLGATYFISGNKKKAEEVWDKGLALNPESSINYIIISNYAIQNRAFEIAINYLKEGKKSAKNPEQFSYQLASVYAYTMDYKKATEEYASLLLTQPNQLNYIKRRMESYIYAAGALDESIEVLEEDKAHNSIKELLSFLYIKKGEYDKAFEFEKELDKLQNRNGIRIYNLANIAYQNSNYIAASKMYQYFIEHFQNSNLIPNAKIKFARTLEAKLNKAQAQKNKWKPLTLPKKNYADKYYPVLKTYSSLLPFLSGNLKSQAFYRIGYIWFYQFFNTDSATKYFKKTINYSSLTEYYGKANLQLSKIYLINNKLKSAKKNLQNVFASSQTKNKTKTKAKFLLAKIQFYQYDFNGSITTLADITKNLSNDLANDAIQLSIIINTGKRDSINLAKFALADLYTYQYKFPEAEKIFKELSKTENFLLLNNIAKYKYAEILIAENNYPVAIEILKELSDKKEMNIFADKSFYLLAQVYEYGVTDYASAISTYEKFLEKFPGSLYLEKVQNNLKQLKNKKVKSKNG